MYDLAELDVVLAWVTVPDRSLEVEARVLALDDCRNPHSTETAGSV
ncbi:hypothetical protein [Curtobacterium sp. ME12]|nr:hypothetical protein [Curtobacterium sp. ME12]